jgi:hypothetical protein
MDDISFVQTVLDIFGIQKVGTATKLAMRLSGYLEGLVIV